MNRRDFLKCSLGMALGAVLGCGDSNEHHGSLFIRPYEEFQKIVEETSISQLLTETDSPYLSPFKEERNEPSFIVETIKIISKINRKKKMRLSQLPLKLRF